MTEPTYFTVVADFRSVAADSTTDLDADPTITPVSAIVTFKPVIPEGAALLAVDATPRPTAYIPAPIVAKIATDGRLKLRDEPDGTRVNAATYAALPATGNANNYYVVTSTGTHYRWTGSTYTEILPYQPVRLLAKSDLLNLGDAPLTYQVTFTQVIYNGRAGRINGFTFQAPVADLTINLVSVMPGPGAGITGNGLNAPMLLSAYFTGDNELVFVNADSTELSPIEIPSGVMVFLDNGDSTWSVA